MDRLASEVSETFPLTPFAYWQRRVSFLCADGTTVGTAWFRKTNVNDVDRGTIDAIKTALKLGYHHIDGAEFYNTENDIGAAIKESGIPREKLFITSKVQQNYANIPEAFDASLKKLGLDYVDLSVILPCF